jgi:hypothetical protein
MWKIRKFSIGPIKITALMPAKFQKSFKSWSGKLAMEKLFPRPNNERNLMDNAKI